MPRSAKKPIKAADPLRANPRLVQIARALGRIGAQSLNEPVPQQSTEPNSIDKEENNDQ
jgi:hypothetical protein